MRRLLTPVIIACIFLCSLPASAGTTGGLSGKVTDAQTGQPIAGAQIYAISPSQTAATVSDAAGNFRLVSLAPDQYDVRVEKSGFQTTTQSGIAIFADQVVAVTIAAGRIGAAVAAQANRGPGYVQPGVTSNLYSIRANDVRRLQALSGAGNIDHAYSAMQTIPGIFIPVGQAGWFQILSIRGGDQDQVGYEFDGVPVVRRFDNTPVTMLSNLGQQELQVYTGGIPATSDATGISGYVNQVVQQGTKAGFANVTLGVGGPGFYHKAQVEAGGATADGRFSYYAGFSGINQSFNYRDMSNGGISSAYFFPLNIPTNNAGVYDGGPASFTTGSAFGLASLWERESVVNLHLGIPHKHDSLMDDVQLLYSNGMENSDFYSSINDLGGECAVNPVPSASNPCGSPFGWVDAQIYTGQTWKAPQASGFGYYSFPSSPAHALGTGAPFSDNLRDGTYNDSSIVKLQYQHNFTSDAYVRLFGYSVYSDWFLNGPVSNNLNYGYELADWEPMTHTYGLTLNAAAQLSAHHALTFSASTERTHNLWVSSSGTFPFQSGPPQITSYVDPATDNCYDYTTGLQASCFASATQGVWGNPTPGSAAPQDPNAHPTWLVTDNGYNQALSNTHTQFWSAALSDQWHPSDRLVADIGLRAENFAFLFGDTGTSDPARQFWFNAFNNENCYANGVTHLTSRAPGAPCPTDIDVNGNVVQTSPTNLQNISGGSYSTLVLQPRISFTYAMGADNVVRGSYGVYARPPYANWMQYNTQQENLASFLGSSFYAYGFNTPEHNLRPDKSYNMDLSWEHHFAGTRLAFKVTPFFRSTQDQEQIFDINPLTALESGLNVGHQTTYGVEFLLGQGTAADEGWSWQLAYTHLRSRIRYSDFATGYSVIDLINQYIKQYNSYTTAGPCFTPAGTPDATCNAGDTQNLYYKQPAQPLLSRTGEYTTYDIFPGPFIGANGYETPDFGSFVATYHRGPWSVTPSLVFNSGASYGSPLVWPGYDPAQCAPVSPSNPAPDTTTCNGFIFTPDKYTGSFDALGAFKQPWRMTGNLELSYRTSHGPTFRLTLSNLFDVCHQRGYAWDNAGVCVYSQLPASIAPAGNFVPLSSAPPQLQYPYAMWNDNLNLAYLGSRLPMQAVFEVQFQP